jgi:outer membrane receptor protein involved in Fe transport
MHERKIKPLVHAIRTGLSLKPREGMRHSLLAIGLSALAVGAQAQQAVADAVAPDAQIETVTVTARKSNELVQDVPMSISTVSAAQMVRENLVTVRDYYSKIPGLNVGRTGGRTDISIRGITTGANTNPTMAVTIDDSPFGSSTSGGGGSQMMPDLDPFDLQRIEVLRGPQGTLYGASNLGGLIKYVTVAPNPNKLSGKVQVDGSSVAHGDAGYGVRGAINIPIIKQELALRVSVVQREDPGWIDNRTTGESNVNSTTFKGGRAAILWTPNDRFTVKASGLHQKAVGNGTATEAIDTKTNLLYGEYVAAAMPGTGQYERTIDFGDLVMTGDLGFATLTSTTSYGRLKFEGPQDLSSVFGGLLERILQAPLGASTTSPLSLNKRTQEFRLDSPEGASKLDWRAGLFFTDEDATSGQTITARVRTTGALVGAPVLSSSNSTTSYKEYAAFGVLTYHFTDQFDVQGGIRYSENQQAYFSRSSGILVGTKPDFNGESKESKSTYMLTPRYKVSKDLMVYGTVSTGYRPGGPNTTLATNIPTTYGSDTTTNFELGAKGQFFNNRLAVDAAVFYIDWKDLQVVLRDAATAFSYTANAGGAKSEGAEVSAVFYPAKGWTVSGNAAYTHAILTTSAGATSNGFAGDMLPYVAKLTGALSINRDFTLSNGWTAFAGVSGAFVGDRYMSFGETPTTTRYHAPSYASFGLAAGVRNGDWTFNAFVKNLSDKRGILSLGSTAAVAPSTAFPITQSSLNTITPRTIGMSLARTF